MSLEVIFLLICEVFLQSVGVSLTDLFNLVSDVWYVEIVGYHW